MRRITIDNEARMNALNKAMWQALPGLIEEAEQDTETRVVVLRGAGTRAFSAGADISEFGEARTGKAAKAYDALNQTAFDTLWRCAKPTLAMISGYCMGGGLELALCCDLRLASDDAQFAIPAAKLGVGYNPRWFAPLLAVVQPAILKELIYTGRRINAEEALAIGALNEIRPAEELEAAASNKAKAIAANAPLSILAAKRAIDAHAHALSKAQLDELDELVAALFRERRLRRGPSRLCRKAPAEIQGQLSSCRSGPLGQKRQYACFEGLVANGLHVIAVDDIERLGARDQVGEALGRTADHVLGANRDQHGDAQAGDVFGRDGVAGRPNAGSERLEIAPCRLGE